MQTLVLGLETNIKVENDSTNTKIEAIQAKMVAMDAKIESLDTKIESMDAKMDAKMDRILELVKR